MIFSLHSLIYPSKPYWNGKIGCYLGAIFRIYRTTLQKVITISLRWACPNHFMKKCWPSMQNDYMEYDWEYQQKKELNSTQNFFLF